MRKILVTLALVLILVVSFAMPAFAATTQDVEVTATPGYIAISNSPTSWAAGTITADTDVNTGNDYFTITNTSTVISDISFYVSDNWSTWTYGAPAADTAQLKVSSGEGGVGGSTGSGNYDKTLVWGSGNAVLVCDNLSALSDAQWEMELDAPTSFGSGTAQSANITMTAVVAS